MTPAPSSCVLARRSHTQAAGVWSRRYYPHDLVPRRSVKTLTGHIWAYVSATCLRRRRQAPVTGADLVRVGGEPAGQRCPWRGRGLRWRAGAACRPWARLELPRPGVSRAAACPITARIPAVCSALVAEKALSGKPCG